MPAKTLVKKAATNPEGVGPPSRALSKGIEIVDLLSSSDSPLSLRTIAHEIRLGKPSTFRLLQTLVNTGVIGTSGNGDYYPIRRFSAVQGSTWVESLIAASREAMERVSAELAEAVTLAALFEDHIRVVHTLESTREIRMSNYLTRILSPYASSLGKAIAAFQSPARLNQLLQVYGVYPITVNTITEPTLILNEMARTRERGYSAEFEETVKGGCCFGAPIRAQDQNVRAAISVSLPVSRLAEGLESRLADMLKEAASHIEKNLAGGHSHTHGRAKIHVGWSVR
jgi:DNA-binding IclR family transcriptional regulator